MKRILFIVFFTSIFSFSQNKTNEIKSVFKTILMHDIPIGSEFLLDTSFDIFNFYKHSKNGNSKKFKNKDYDGGVIRFLGYEEKKELIYLVFEYGDSEIKYFTNKKMTELKSEYCLTIPKLFYFEDFKLAEKLLKGKRITKKKTRSIYELLEDTPQVYIIENLIYDDLYDEILVATHTEGTVSEKHTFRTRFSATNYFCSTHFLVNYFFDKYEFIEDFEYRKQIQITEKEDVEKHRKISNENMILNWEKSMQSKISKVKDSCHYISNKLDPIKDTKEIITQSYSLYSGSFENGRLNVSILKLENQNYLRIYTTDDVGCASYYDSNKSSVIFKLENGDKVKFYHTGQVNCRDFELLGKLSNSEIVRLKKSPIEMVRVEGTKHYSDIDNLIWKTFFQDKLDCIEN